jgi:hypothetical protein
MRTGKLIVVAFFLLVRIPPLVSIWLQKEFKVEQGTHAL